MLEQALPTAEGEAVARPTRRLHDVVWKSTGEQLWLLGALLLFGTSGWLIALRLDGAGLDAATLFLWVWIGGGMLLIRAVALRGWKHDFERSGSSAAISVRIQQVARSFRPFFSEGLVRWLREASWGQFRPGDVIRVGKGLSKVTPLEVGFEPTLLDASQPAFQQLADPGGEPIRESFWRRSQRWTMITSGIAQTIFAHLILGPIAAVVVLTVYLLLIGSSWLFTPSWFVVPGGLLQRSPRRRYLRADRCRMVVLQTGQGARFWILLPDGRRVSLTLLGPETQLLLRAWLSPLPPPTEEQLRDW